MKLLDRFKKPGTSTAPHVKRHSADSPSSAGEGAVPKAKASESIIMSRNSRAHRVLLKPVISEKSAMLHSYNQYVFMVHPDANKIQIKQAVREIYKSMPLDVRIIVMEGKKVTRGTVRGQRRAFKKAVVTMPKGVVLPL